jgi:hypothetical protein
MKTLRLLAIQLINRHPENLMLQHLSQRNHVVVNESQVDDETGCNCEFCESCSFFIERLSVLPELAKQVREHYCYQYKFRCARYVLKQLTGKGDPNLLPSDIKTVAERLGWDL